MVPCTDIECTRRYLLVECHMYLEIDSQGHRKKISASALKKVKLQKKQQRISRNCFICPRLEDNHPRISHQSRDLPNLRSGSTRVTPTFNFAAPVTIQSYFSRAKKGLRYKMKPFKSILMPRKLHPSPKKFASVTILLIFATIFAHQQHSSSPFNLKPFPKDTKLIFLGNGITTME